jgi:putative hydrolase of the HAD superfamily
VKAVLLDALGTLVALEPPAPHLREELRSRFGVAVSEEEAATAVAAEIAYYRAHHLEGTRDGLDDLRLRCAEVLRDALPEPAARALPVTDARDALMAALRFSAFDDAAPALRELRGRGLRLVVVSNWDAGLSEVLARVGLAGFLDGVVTSADAGAVKPSAAPFSRALSLVGAAPGEALHVGNEVEADVGGAGALGLAAALIVRDGAPPADVGAPVISSLAELPALVYAAPPP